MRGLLEFAARENVRRVVEQMTKFTAVQGVVAEYHPLWMLLQRVDPSLWDLWFDHPFPFRYGPYPVDGRPTLGPPREKIWRRWREWNNNDPYQLRICLVPSEAEGEENLPEIGETDFPVVFERRPLARFVNDRGLRTHAGADIGTLGGAVKSVQNEWLGVTCAHVVENAPTVEVETEKDTSLMQWVRGLLAGKASARLSGECVRKTELVALGADGACNPYGKVDPSNSIDVALVKADFRDVDLVRWEQGAAARSSASTGQYLKMLSSDGVRDAELGGLAVYYVLNHDKKRFCFSGLFEVRAPRYSPKVVHPGDSGAWIMRPGASGDEWFGMVLGSDDIQGYAMFAEPVYEWVQSAIPQP
jgi:hypothetical protein